MNDVDHFQIIETRLLLIRWTSIGSFHVESELHSYYMTSFGHTKVSDQEPDWWETYMSDIKPGLELKSIYELRIV